MKWYARRAIVVSVLMLALLSGGCQRDVEVKTGTRVTCAYGHVISDDVRTIKVPSKEASRHAVRNQVSTCAKHRQIEALYAEAQKAIKASDMDKAEESLKKIAALDPTYGDVSKQLADLRAGKKPKADSGRPATNTGGADSGDDDTSVPAGKLAVWTPDTLKGYKASKIKVDVFTVTREYVPADRAAVIMVLVAEQQRTSSGAKALLDRMVKQPCPKDVDKMRINGRDVYFGTDGTRLAAIGFTEGPVMVAMQIALAREGSPKSLKSALVAVAKQLP